MRRGGPGVSGAFVNSYGDGYRSPQRRSGNLLEADRTEQAIDHLFCDTSLVSQSNAWLVEDTYQGDGLLLQDDIAGLAWRIDYAASDAWRTATEAVADVNHGQWHAEGTTSTATGFYRVGDEGQCSQSYGWNWQTDSERFTIADAGSRAGECEPVDFEGGSFALSRFRNWASHSRRGSPDRADRSRQTGR